MTIADKLRNQGFGNADFTKDDLMDALVKSNGSKTYIIGRHVGTKIKENTIGMCNPCNRDFLMKCLVEEGFKWDFHTNKYGVESICIHL